VGDRAAPVMAYIIERLPDHPAMVISRSGEVLLQTRVATALFGRAPRHLIDRWLADPAARERYRHAELGELELYRQLLVDLEDHQMLLVFTAEPGSPTDEKLRLLAATSG
jgi:hypothetical protein